jgi:hypothetical protein
VHESELGHDVEVAWQVTSCVHVHASGRVWHAKWGSVWPTSPMHGDSDVVPKAVDPDRIVASATVTPHTPTMFVGTWQLTEARLHGPDFWTRYGHEF